MDKSNEKPPVIRADERREYRGMGVHCVHFNLRRASRITARLFERAFAPLGLTGVQFNLLIVLASVSKPMTVQELARLVSTDRTTLTRDLRLVREKGWVIPVEHADKRRRQMTISQTGLDAFRAALPAWREAQAKLTRLLGDDAWYTTRRNIKKIIRRGPALVEEVAIAQE